MCAAGRADIQFSKARFYNICCCGAESSRRRRVGERISKSVALAECLALHLIFWRCRKSARGGEAVGRDFHPLKGCFLNYIVFLELALSATQEIKVFWLYMCVRAKESRNPARISMSTEMLCCFICIKM